MSLQHRAAAHEKWAKCSDRAAAVAPMRAGLKAWFVAQVDPDGILPARERELRAASAERAHYLRLAAFGVAARKAKARV